MSLKDVAKDLYRAQQEVERIQELLAAAGPEDEQELKARLRDAQAEWKYLRNIINGRKKSTVLQRKF